MDSTTTKIMFVGICLFTSQVPNDSGVKVILSAHREAGRIEERKSTFHATRDRSPAWLRSIRPSSCSRQSSYDGDINWPPLVLNLRRSLCAWTVSAPPASTARTARWEAAVADGSETVFTA